MPLFGFGLNSRLNLVWATRFYHKIRHSQKFTDRKNVCTSSYQFFFSIEFQLKCVMNGFLKKMFIVIWCEGLSFSFLIAKSWIETCQFSKMLNSSILKFIRWFQKCDFWWKSPFKLQHLINTFFFVAQNQTVVTVVYFKSF